MTPCAEDFETLRVRLESLLMLFNERDRLYTERHEAAKDSVKAAISSLREKTDAAFRSGETAMLKAEESLKEYKTTSNEFRGTLADQAATLMTRRETEQLIDAVEKSLERYREESRVSWDLRAREAIARFDTLRAEIQWLREQMVAAATKDRIADPVMTRLLTAVESLQGARDTQAGRSHGMSGVFSGASGVIAVIALLLGIGTAIFTMTRSTIPVAPVYAPVPGGQVPVPK